MSKVVLITGSSRGIGKSIATLFAKNNFKVVINCKSDTDSLKSLEKQLLKINKNILAIKCDVSIYSDVTNMFNSIISTFGTIDVVINNAGISHIGLFTDSNISNWDTLINTNIKGVLNTCHIFTPHMIKQKSGHIINISSIWGISGASCEVIYSMTKSAINGFSKALGKELAPSNIFVNSIACGLIDTNMNNSLSSSDINNFVNDIPLNKIGTPNDIANFCLFLSTQNTYMVSQVITIDGGYL